MSDLTARLRATYVAWLVDPTNCINARCNEAADRIDALEVENARLRETLRDWPWVPAIDVEVFYRNQARDQ